MVYSLLFLPLPPMPLRVIFRFLVLCLALATGLVIVPHSGAQGTLISAASRRDLVFDHAGKYLYITTSDGSVARFNLLTNQLEAPYVLGGSLNGADIAEDDSFLLVAQEQVVNGQGKFQKINLTTGGVTDINYSTAAEGEWGGYSVTIAANGIALVTTERQPQTSGGNSFPLRAINPASNTISIRRDLAGIGESTAFGRSFDGTLLYTGGLLMYHSATDSFTATNLAYTGSPSVSTSINRDKTLFGRSTQFYGGAIDRVSDLAFIHAFRQISGGVVFDPMRDLLYAADSVNGVIRAFDTNTFEPRFQLDIGEYLGPSYSLGGFGSGRLAVSPNGKFLALSTPTGVRLFTIPSPPYPALPRPDYGEPRGLVFDNQSGYLYATTTTGYVLGFNVATTALERIYHVGGWLYGIDIAADDSYLLVAQAYFGIKQGAVQKINIATGAVTNLTYDRGNSERGALDVHLAANNRAFFSTSVDSDNAPVRQIELATGAVTTRDDIPIPDVQRYLRGNLQIQRSADRSLLYFVDPTSSSGLTFTYRAANDSFGAGGDISTYFDLTNAAVNRNGSQAALRYANTVELQSGPDFHTTHSFPDFTCGVAFNAVKDVVYALTTTTDEIVAYDTNTFAELSRMWIGEDIDGTVVGKLFGIGSIVASQDGRYLALLAPSGISLFDLQNPPPPRFNYNVTATASPAAGGAITGAGTFSYGSNVVVIATANPGYVFAGWTENGNLVSTSEAFSFPVYSDRTLVAKFLSAPTLTISVSPPKINRGGSATFTVSRSFSNPAKGVSVNYVLAGTAVPGTDYSINGPANVITIPAGQSSTTVTLTATTTRTKKSVKATMVLVSGADYQLSAAKKKKNPNQATVTIANR